MNTTVLDIQNREGDSNEDDGDVDGLEEDGGDGNLEVDDGDWNLEVDDGDVDDLEVGVEGLWNRVAVGISALL